MFTRRWGVLARAALAGVVGVLFVVLCSSLVLAQSTGGSFGGSGDFGGGGGSSGGSSGSGGGDGFAALRLIVLLVHVIGPAPTALLLLVVGLGWWIVRGRRSVEPARGGGTGWSQVDVTAIRIAVDWRFRRAVQERLDTLARQNVSSTRGGLSALLRGAAEAVLEAKTGWLYASVTNFHPMAGSIAESHYKQLTVAARAGFENELVRSTNGRLVEQAANPQLRAREEEGQGVVLVSFVVAARRELLDIRANDANELAAGLRGLTSLGPGQLIGMEVVWTPAADADRMSTAELEARYPEVKKIDERSIGGRIFCGYCRGPFPAELAACPHCGGPSPHAQDQAHAAHGG